ncbi:hypothetical protein E2C01_061484 [Portunus trituberculatus]|uniref:Uncharacterized protein n=1 Tax=Portunus trituberculatus TaxID=210409 RepID=A0A5B7H401_PORTR|nr:hypothetical protein [Portunus trituberculatus]
MYSQVIRRAITRPPHFPALQAGGKLLIKTVSTILCGLDAVIPVEEDVPHPPPWLTPVPDVHFTPTSTAAHPALQQQLALETISTMSSSFPVLCLLYTDGSLQSDGRAGCAVFSEDMNVPPGGWYRRRGVMVRRHNVVSARLRLGYRPVWQVAGQVDVPLFPSCHLCGIPKGNSLDHYCLHCPEVDGLLPRGLSLLDVCRHLLNEDNLDVLLARCPCFGGC